LDEGSVESIKVIKEAGQELGEPRELTPDTDKVLWFGVAKNDGRITLKEAGEYAYEVVREDNSKYIFFFDYDPALVQGVVGDFAAEVDYNAVWNESRETWYIKVTVPGENLDEGSIESIKVIKEAGQELDEPRELTPDTDTMLWFGVAQANGNLAYKAAGEYAYEVVRKDDSKYIFHFTYDPDIVDGVLPAVSTYVFECSELKDVVAGEDVEANVTLKTAKLGRMGYTAVLFEFEKTEGSGDVTFTAVDSKGAKHTFTNSGTWGPPGGFELPAEYEAETDWILNFSRPGNYNITFELVDLDSYGEVIVEDSATVYVAPATEAPGEVFFEGPDDVTASDELVFFTLRWTGLNDHLTEDTELEFEVTKDGETIQTGVFTYGQAVAGGKVSIDSNGDTLISMSTRFRTPGTYILSGTVSHPTGWTIEDCKEVDAKPAGVITKTAYWGTPDNVLYYFDFELVAGVKIGDLESLVARAYDGENLLSTISLKEEKFEEYAGLTKLGGSFRSNPDLSPSSSWNLEAFDGTMPTKIVIEYVKDGKTYTFGIEDIEWINEGYKLVSNITKTKGYDTIQAAINDADEDDEIRVGDGEFSENLTVAKPLTLASFNGREQVKLTGTITITADNVTIEGFTVVAPDDFTSAPVIHMIGANNVNILANKVTANYNATGQPAIGTSTGPAKVTGRIAGNIVEGAIGVGTDGELEVVGNTVTAAASEGIWFYPIGPSAELTIMNNSVTDMQLGSE
jgi:hypothetical protein